VITLALPIEAMISLALMSILKVSIGWNFILCWSKNEQRRATRSALRDSLRLRFWLPDHIRRTGHVGISALFSCGPLLPKLRETQAQSQTSSKTQKDCWYCRSFLSLEAADTPHTNGITARRKSQIVRIRAEVAA
jgi:hypothetical protein